MIRLIIVLIGVLLLWILFFSSFNKRQKIILSVIAILTLIAGVWYENYGEKPKLGLISSEQIISCGISAEHSYRSDFKIEYCLQNSSKIASSKRLVLRFSAEDCGATNCVIIESVDKDINLEIKPQQQHNGSLSLAFDAVQPSNTDVEWKLEVISVKAVK